MSKSKIIFTFAVLFAGIFGLAESSLAADFCVAQTAQGGDTGVDCANAHSAFWFNTSSNWANPKVEGKIGPGDTAHLCGIITDLLTPQASGTSGSPITILNDSAIFGGNYGEGIVYVTFVRFRNFVAL